MKRYRDKKQTKTIQLAMDKASSITFEIVKYVNDISKLKKSEEVFLLRNVGLKLCLNTEIECTSAFKRGKAIYKIAKLNSDGSIIKVYDSISVAAKELGITRMNVCVAVKSKYPRTKYILRQLDGNGKVIIPSKPYRDCAVLKKPIIQYDKEMNFISIFESMEDAARKLKLDRKGIACTAKNKQKTCGGFIFRFAALVA